MEILVNCLFLSCKVNACLLLLQFTLVELFANSFICEICYHFYASNLTTCTVITNSFLHGVNFNHHFVFFLGIILNAGFNKHSRFQVLPSGPKTAVASRITVF